MNSAHPNPAAHRKWPRIVGAVFGLIFLGLTFLMIDTWSALGTRPEGKRLARIERSEQYQNGRFTNPLPQQDAEMLPVLKRWIFDDNPHRIPVAPLPVMQRVAREFTDASSDLRVTWFGHSSLLVELEGQRILIDPMWGDYASPGRVFGVKRFFAPPMPLDELPEINAVILSHDHYDHLNEPTIKALRDKVPRFVVPLGLGAHLEYWGVSPDRITELDWWEHVTLGGVDLVCAPARHFSGRSLTDRNATLWAGWAMIGQTRRAFFSGDSGMFPGFAEIGDRLGPFDITMMETGAYNTDWPDVHMGPEQAVAAHQMVGGGLMLPIHWGTFNLAFHGWTEPVERLLVAAENAGVQVAVPRPGESIVPTSPALVERWWPTQPWKTAEDVPIISTGLPLEIGALLR